jgi:PRC-barrel domain protein
VTEQVDPSVSMPGLAEATAWRGFAVDDVDGVRVGRVEGVYADAVDGAPAWLIVELGRRPRLRRRRRDRIAIPLRECAAAAGRVWTAHRQGSLRAAPTVDPARPLLREHELAICAHYGIGERIGRAAEVAGSPEGAVTAQPATPRPA